MAPDRGATRDRTRTSSPSPITAASDVHRDSSAAPSTGTGGSVTGVAGATVVLVDGIVAEEVVTAVPCVGAPPPHATAINANAGISAIARFEIGIIPPTGLLPQCPGRPCAGSRLTHIPPNLDPTRRDTKLDNIRLNLYT